MKTVVRFDGDELIEQRRAAGIDRLDEVINGTYYCRPPRPLPAGRIVSMLGARLNDAGLDIAMDVGTGTAEDFVIPAVTIYRKPVEPDTRAGEPNAVWFVVELDVDPYRRT